MEEMPNHMSDAESGAPLKGAKVCLSCKRLRALNFFERGHTEQADGLSLYCMACARAGQRGRGNNRDWVSSMNRPGDAYAKPQQVYRGRKE